MALDLGGHRAAAERAYDWLIDLQRADGSWHQYYLADEQGRTTSSRTSSTPTSAPTWPPASGTTGCSPRTAASPRRCGRSSSGPSTSCSSCRPHAARSSGPATPTARRGRFALLTGSSSICHSLRCAIALAELLGHERPDWELSAARLAHAIATVPDAFAPKHRWAMDWYYPVLAGVVLGDAGRARLAARRDTFVARRQGHPLRVRPPVDHRGRDLRVRPGPPRRRRPPHRRGALRLGPAVPPRRGRPLLDRHRLPAGEPLPRRRALHLHRRLRGPRRRRPRRPVAGLRAVRRPRQRPAEAHRPRRRPRTRRHSARCPRAQRRRVRRPQVRRRTAEGARPAATSSKRPDSSAGR